MRLLARLFSFIYLNIFAAFTKRRYRPYLVLLGPRKFRQIKATTHDPRELMLKTAGLLGVSELDVALQIAKRFGLPCLMHVQALAPELWPQDEKLGYQRFYVGGAIPLANQGIICGVVCCDPWLAKELIEKLSQEKVDHNRHFTGLIPIYLAAWHEIKSALDSSLELVHKQESAAKQLQSERLHELAQKSLAVLVRNMEEAGQNCLDLNLSESCCAYSFVSQDGSLASGQIDPLIRESLLEILSTKDSTLPGSCRDIYLPDLKRPIRVKAANGLSEFILSYGGAKSNLLTFPLSSALVPPSRELPELERGPSTRVQIYSDYVLMVDDNPTFVKVLEKFMQRNHFKTKTFECCEQALEFLKSTDELPAVVICDLHLPGMSGQEFTAKFKKSAALSRIPLIILSSDEDLETELQLIALGADVYLSKNQDPRLLCTHVKSLAGKASGREAA